MSRQQPRLDPPPSGPAAPAPPARRSRGDRAGLELKQIVAAARALPPEQLTMRAVADALGVDRKSLNWHVRDRETLAAAVALDAFAADSAAMRIPADAGWQAASRIYARGLADGVIALGGLARYLPPGSLLLTQTLDASEAILTRFSEAGLSHETAQRLLAVLHNIALAYARDVLDIAQDRVRVRSLREALSEQDASKYPYLSRVAADPHNTYDRRQLEFTLDLLLTGVAAAVRNDAGG